MQEEIVDEGIVHTETIASYAILLKNDSGNQNTPMLFQKAKVVLREIEEQYQIEVFSSVKVILSIS